ncbi:MAG: DUF1475 family protein [Anaerolineaceae bacterium]
MKIAKIVGWFGLLAMTGILIYGFTQGDFGKDGAVILANPWGRVSMVDLYVGFILFSAWIVFREKNPFLSAVWVILMMVLGFFTASLYVLLQTYRSNGDWLDFFLGKQKEKVLKTVGDFTQRSK